MEMMDTISSKRIFLIIESHKNNIESIDEIDSENRCNSRYFSSGYDSERRNHKSNEHCPRFPEQYLRFYIIQPTNKDRRDENCKTEKYEDGISLRKRRRVYEIEFDSKKDKFYLLLADCLSAS